MEGVVYKISSDKVTINLANIDVANILYSIIVKELAGEYPLAGRKELVTSEDGTIFIAHDRFRDIACDSKIAALVEAMNVLASGETKRLVKISEKDVF